MQVETEQQGSHQHGDGDGESVGCLHVRGMPFGVKSLEKRQNELVQKLFPDGNNGISVNATRLVVRACELRIIDIDNLQADEE